MMDLSPTDIEKLTIISQAGWCKCKSPSRIGESAVCTLCIKVIKSEADNQAGE